VINLFVCSYCAEVAVLPVTRLLIRVLQLLQKRKVIVGFEPTIAARRADALPLSYMTPSCSSNFCYIYPVELPFVCSYSHTYSKIYYFCVTLPMLQTVALVSAGLTQ
jgi:hypothetical protein